MMPARLLARAIASLEPCDSSTPTMIVLMTVLSDWGGWRSRNRAREARVKERGEVVERLCRGAVRAQDDVVAGRDVSAHATVVGLAAHHVRVSVRDGGRVTGTATSALQPDRDGSAALDHGAGRQVAERRPECRPVCRAPERRVDEHAGRALQLALREPAELRVGAAVEALAVGGRAGSRARRDAQEALANAVGVEMAHAGAGGEQRGEFGLAACREPGHHNEPRPPRAPREPLGEGQQRSGAGDET